MLNILIADDDPVTVKLLSTAVEKWNHKPTCVTNGTDALDVMLSDSPPELAILDWHMPGLTGLEVSAKHKTAECSQFTYKIILSGSIGRDDIIAALHSGAHDVLLKPIDLPLIKSRLDVGIAICKEKRALLQMHDIMQRYAEEMERLAEERAQQLVASDRIASLGVMSAGIAHEINNPMSFISGNVQDLKRYWTDLLPLVETARKQNNTDCAKIDFIVTELPKVLESIQQGTQRVTTIVKSLKKYSARGTEQKQVLDLNDCVGQALELSKYSTPKNVAVKSKFEDTQIKIIGNPLEIEQVLVNLVVNAGDALSAQSRGEITVVTKKQQDSAIIEVRDNGPGIPENLLSKIWDPFFTTKPIGKGTGLGLAICTGIVRNHGGTIGAANLEQGGAVFTVKFKLDSAKDAKS